MLLRRKVDTVSAAPLSTAPAPRETPSQQRSWIAVFTRRPLLVVCISWLRRARMPRTARAHRAHRAELQRDPPPIDDLRDRTRPGSCPRRPLVDLATTPPILRRKPPLPATTTGARTNVTI